MDEFELLICEPDLTLPPSLMKKKTKEVKKFNLVTVTSHGGHCCGLSHLYQMSAASEENILERIKQQVDGIEGDAASEYGDYTEDDEFIPRDPPWDKFGHAFEVTLVDQQMKEMGPILKKIGFKHVFRWKNDNSGNFVNLLMYKTNDEDEETPPPFNWDEM